MSLDFSDVLYKLSERSRWTAALNAIYRYISETVEDSLGI